MCRGTKIYKSGYHNPQSPYKWKSCPYCDYESCQLIEASEGAIVEYLSQLSDEALKQLLLKLN